MLLSKNLKKNKNYFSENHEETQIYFNPNKPVIDLIDIHSRRKNKKNKKNIIFLFSGNNLCSDDNTKKVFKDFIHSNDKEVKIIVNDFSDIQSESTIL